jgi:hypothetical protein
VSLPHLCPICFLLHRRAVLCPARAASFRIAVTKGLAEAAPVVAVETAIAETAATSAHAVSTRCPPPQMTISGAATAAARHCTRPCSNHSRHSPQFNTHTQHAIEHLMRISWLSHSNRRSAALAAAVRALAPRGATSSARCMPPPALLTRH